MFRTSRRSGNNTLGSHAFGLFTDFTGNGVDNKRGIPRGLFVLSHRVEPAISRTCAAANAFILTNDRLMPAAELMAFDDPGRKGKM